jgi:hypothetical protein
MQKHQVYFIKLPDSILKLYGLSVNNVKHKKRIFALY